MPQSNGLCVSFVCMTGTEEPKEITTLRATLLRGVLPGWEAQSLACPPGRPHDVATKVERARRAGVMCLLCPNPTGQWSVVLVKRTEDGTPHSGQLAFPGGAEDAEDGGDLTRTAVRECWEEIGIDVPDHRILGELSPLYIPPSDFFVQPVLSWSPDAPQFKLQEDEVAEVYSIPLGDLPQAQTEWPSQRVPVRGGTASVPGWPCQGQILWGATAMMMAEVIALCGLAGFGTSFAKSTTFEE